MKVQGPSKKLQAVNDALSKLPRKRFTSDQARQQVIQHRLESKRELLKNGLVITGK